LPQQTLVRVSIVIILVLVAGGKVATAQDCPAIVAFGNGIWTDQEEADWSLRQLRAELNRALADRSRPTLPGTCFLLAWARNNWNDVLEAASQVTQEDSRTLVSWLFGVQPASATFERILVDDLLGSSFDTLFPQAAQDLEIHLQSYSSVIDVNKRKVILVAHSQGNLFANEAYRRLGLPPEAISAASFSIVPVATPAGTSTAGLSHITLFGDIILWVATQDANTDVGGTPCIPNPIDPGAPPIPGFNGVACHSFRGSYLIGSSSQSSILNEVMASIPSGSRIDDDFNDNSLDASKWSSFSSISGSTVVETNQRLEISLAPGGPGGAGVISSCSLNGDFDVQVDYALINWPPMNAYGLSLGAIDLGGSIFRNSGGTQSPLEFYTMVAGGSAAQLPTTDTAGKLRLVRSGSVLSGFFLNGSTWTQVGSGSVSTSATRFSLSVGPNVSAPGGIQIAFDNFKASAGTVSCPP
jgi:hypothetical protein